jgi:SEC-C motif
VTDPRWAEIQLPLWAAIRPNQALVYLLDPGSSLKGWLGSRETRLALPILITDACFRVLFPDHPLIDFILNASAVSVELLLFGLNCARFVGYIIREVVCLPVGLVDSLHHLAVAARNPGEISAHSCPCNSGKLFRNCHGKGGRYPCCSGRVNCGRAA